MVNLLPTAAKKQIVTEYYLRVLTVWLFLCTGATVMLGMLLLPVAVLVNLQLSAYDASFVQVSADNASFAEAEAAVKRANQLAGVLDGVRKYAPVWPQISFVMESAGTNIEISEVRVDRDKEAVKTVVVSGEAATRAALAAYRDVLESDARVESAALPLSNLAKDRDLPFSIEITLRQESE